MKEKQKHNDTTAAALLKWSQINTMTYFCLRERVNNSIYVSSIHLPTCLTSETINRLELIKKKNVLLIQLPLNIGSADTYCEAHEDWMDIF